MIFKIFTTPYSGEGRPVACAKAFVYFCDILLFQGGGLKSNREGSGSAAVILYVGLGMVAVGLVITFVGVGDKGFKTVELQLIGPSLVGCGLCLAMVRILFCTVPACCGSCVEKQKQEQHEIVEEEEQFRSNVKTAGARNGLVKPVRDMVGVTVREGGRQGERTRHITQYGGGKTDRQTDSDDDSY